MTNLEQLAKLKATREAREKRLQEIMAKSVEGGRSMQTDEQEEFDTVELDIKNLEGDISRLQRLIDIEKKSAQPPAPSPAAGKPADDGTRQPHTLQLRSAETIEPGVSFARRARVKALAHLGLVGGLRDELAVAKAVYPQDENLIATIEKAAVSAANTLAPTWAGNLITDGGVPFADFVEWLRERSLMGQISNRLRRLPFDTPVLIQGSAGTAKWVKEGNNKPLTSWTYTRTKLSPLKVAAIAAATKETLMRATPAADALLRDELGRACLAAIDGTFISDVAAVADTSPAGILNGVTPLTLSAGSNVADIRCDIATFLNELVDGLKTIAGAFWVMPENVAIALSLIVNEVGASAFPGVTVTGGTLAGLPVFVTGYADTDSDGSVVALIKGDEIFLGDEDGVQVSMSDQATLVMDDAPTGNSITPTGVSPGSQALVNMWQTNSVAFLVERFINWQKRRNAAVVWGRVNWTACQSP